MPRKKATAKPRPSTKKPTVEQVSNALDRHERVCEQKWKENFRRLDSIESDINTTNKRLWQIAGIVIGLLSSLVINAFFM
jgi:tetrahydromethanopterin S-methyltransferase subunit G